MIKVIPFILAIIGVLLSSLSLGQKPAGFDYVENKGQWADSIRYATQLPAGMLNISDGGFAYYYASGKELRKIQGMMDRGAPADSQQIRLHNYQVRYVDANPAIRYSAGGQRPDYINWYYGQDSSTWKGNIGRYGSVTQENVYDGIDVKIYSKTTSLKYDFIVEPGADPADIRLKFEGVNPRLSPDGKLQITTSVNEIIEQPPYAYQLINGVEHAVPCFYVLSNNELRFALPHGYNPHYPLVIDPELVFTTFSGAGDFASGYYSYCTAYDKEGSLYAAGVPSRFFWVPPPQWPTTPGAFQQAWTTVYEPMTCINKYSPDGSGLMFSTYFGGSGPSDLPHSMTVNAQNELILAGSTGSFNLPVTPGCFDDTKSGGTDIFIAHFNSRGTDLIGATYVGGNIGNSINAIDLFSNTGFNNQNKTSPIELTTDSEGNIWVVSNTSTIDFPVTANAFQPAFGGDNADGVVFALNPECTDMLYASYIGGNKLDVAYGIQFNSEGNVVIAGGTKSSDFPTTTGALQQTAPGSGEWDGFVTIFNPTTGDLVASSYLGTAADDQVTHVQVDGFNNVYALGRTFGNYPISSEAFSRPGSDLFIQKLSPDLKTSIVSTRLGNPQSDTVPFFPTAFLVDNCTNVYVTGLSGNYEVPLKDMPLTPDAFQSTPGNFWFGVLKPNWDELLFATYYGRVHDTINGINGDHTHVGANHLDPQGILYQSLCVNSNDYPGTSPDSWSQFNQNRVGQDIVSFKFAFNLAGVTSGFELPAGQADSGCAPFTVQLVNTSTMAMTYFWDFGDGNTSTDPNPTHTYLTEGVYTIALHAHNDTACITDDTSYLTITVFDPKVPDITVNDMLICETTDEVKLSVRVNNPSVHNRYRWEPVAAISGPANQETVIVNPQISTQYIVTVWDTIPGFCGYRTTDTITIDYKPRQLEIHNNDTLICQGTSVQVATTVTGGYSLEWTPTDGVNNVTGEDPIITPTETTTYTLTASYSGCADTSQQLTIQVDDPSGVFFTAEPDSLCAGQPVTFQTRPDSTFQNLFWDFGNGYSREESPGYQTEHAYEQSGTMEVQLTASFRACPDTTTTKTIEVFPFPLVDLGPDSSLCLDGQPLYLKNRRTAAPNVKQHYRWSTGATTEILQIKHPGTYTLSVTAEPLGCTTTETITISKDCYIDIPNAFTPDGDGHNDYFLPRQLLSKSLSRFSMQVFNRWGQLLFETSKLNGRGWDGSFNGKAQPTGVYLYRIEADFSNGRQERYEGNVTLLR